jgi:crotonobetainyl-CoA:carnitine CoA-transferase CaiB-like acyl-CoA transferase
MSDDTRRPPLDGIRVIEMGAFIAGPFCGQLLADLGADVIKIEPPGTGDPMRQWGQATIDGRSLWWPVIARNKRCITLDLRSGEGQRLARDLVMQSDVLVENFRPGTLTRWNLDPANLRREKPSLIVAQVSGFGQTGPYANRAGFAAIAEAMGGLRNLTGFPDRPPARVGISIGDTLAGMFGVIGVLASLVGRSGDRDRRGQSVDVSIVESVLAVMESVISEYSATGALRERSGTSLAKIAPSNLYPTADGELIVIAANADTLFRRLAEAMGRPELAQDPRFADHRARGEHQRELDDLIEDWTQTLPRDDLVQALNERGVPAGPVYDAEDICRDPHFRARGAIVGAETPAAGEILMQGIVPRLADAPGTVRWTGPALGEHNAAVFGDLLGLSSAQIADLAARNVI